LFPDYAFIFHSVLRAYGYIYSSLADFEVMSNIYGLGLEKLYNIYRIMEHPTIKLHFSAYFTRSYSCSSPKRGALGFYTIQSSLVTSVKTKDWLLQFNGQKDDLCYYESDKTYDLLAQLWTFGRVFLYEDSDTAWKPELIPYYPGVVTYDHVVAKFASRPDALGNTTTTVFLPQNSKTILVKSDELIGMWQTFDMIDGEWDVGCEELILVTSIGYHRCLKITPRNFGGSTLTISLNLGEEGDETDLVGLGDGTIFKKNTTFSYVATKTKNVKHPTTLKTLKCLYAEPSLKINPTTNEASGTVIYSNIHSSINEISELPTMNKIETFFATLQLDPKYPDYLFLHDKQSKTVHVGRYDGGYKQSIKIPTTLVQDKIVEAKSDYPQNGGNYVGITNSIYQLSFKSNVGLKE
jgi:hypothetical protein